MRGVFDMAEPIDFNAHRLAVLNKLPARKADAFRGTGDNHIAWVERIQRGTKFNELGYGENQVIGVIVLFENTVQAGAYARMVTGGPLIGSSQPGPKPGGAVEGLAGMKLRGLALDIAQGVVIHNRVASDMVKGFSLGYAVRSLSDDYR